MKPSSSRPVQFLLVYAFEQCLLLTLLVQGVAPSSKMVRTANVSHNLRVTKFQCIDTPYKESILKLCKMQQLPSGKVGVNVSLLVPMEINYMDISVKVFYKYTTYRPFMIDWRVELCQALRTRKFNPSTALVMKVIKETLPQYYHPCPHGKQEYNTMWYFDPKFIPQTLPSGDYRLDTYIRDSSNQTIFALQGYGSVRKQGIMG